MKNRKTNKETKLVGVRMSVELVETLIKEAGEISVRTGEVVKYTDLIRQAIDNRHQTKDVAGGIE